MKTKLFNVILDFIYQYTMSPTLAGNMPICDIPMSQELINKYYSNGYPTIADIPDSIQSDCWAIVCKYKDCDKYVIEYNAYANKWNKDESIFRQEMYDVKTFKSLCDKCDRIDIYMFGVDSWKIQIDMNKTDHNITLWTEK